MGYYTKYELNASDQTGKGRTLDFLQVAKKDNDYFDSLYRSGGDFGESWKWYDHESDVAEVTKLPQFKDWLIELRGEGEEAGDLWIKYFKNGKVQVCRAEIVYPPFDESKLK